MLSAGRFISKPQLVYVWLCLSCGRLILQILNSIWTWGESITLGMFRKAGSPLVVAFLTVVCIIIFPQPRIKTRDVQLYTVELHVIATSWGKYPDVNLIFSVEKHSMVLKVCNNDANESTCKLIQCTHNSYLLKNKLCLYPCETWTCMMCLSQNYCHNL